MFAPGETFQFDFSKETVDIGGQVQTIKVAHIQLCYSRRFLVVAYPRETQEIVFDAHWRAFQYILVAGHGCLAVGIPPLLRKRQPATAGAGRMPRFV